MKLQKTKGAACLLLSAVLLFGCSNQNTAEGTSQTKSSETAITQLSIEEDRYQEEDLDTSWSEENATVITFSGGQAEIKGSGASVKNQIVTVSEKGTYVFRGTWEGQILVNASKDSLVHLVLDGLTLTNPSGSAIYAQQSDKVVITLAKDSTNTVTDGAEYQFAAEEDEPSAAIFSKDDLSLNGEGTLAVTANYKNAIASKDSLVVTGGDYTITAANDGLRGKDSVAIKAGTFNITAKGDGIQSSNDTDSAKGWVAIDGGTYQIQAGNDAIQAETLLEVNGGEGELHTGDGAASVQKTSGDAPDFSQNGTPPTIPSGNNAPTDKAAGAENSSTASTEDTASYKGMKAGTQIAINGGTFTFDCADDAFHSNGNLFYNGGTSTINTGDDGLHADDVLQINDGTIEIAGSYEGLEGSEIYVAGGKVTVNASDDGVNAAGGNDGSGQSGQMATDQFSQSGSHSISISGGELYVNAAGDGLDSNGSIAMTGGTVIVDGPENSGNGALDYDSTCVVDGGILVAVGSSGMAQNVSDTSKQTAVLISYDQQQDSRITLTDEKGNILLSYQPAKTYQTAVISAPTLEKNIAYTLSNGGTVSETEKEHSISTTGTLTGGETLSQITLADTVNTLSQNGEKTELAGPMGGHGGMGGGNMGGKNGMTPPDRNGSNGNDATSKATQNGAASSSSGSGTTQQP